MSCVDPDAHVTLAGDAYDVCWLATEKFDAGWESRWAVEGNCPVTAVDGRLKVRRAGEGAVSTIWYRQPLPRDVIIRFKAMAVEPAQSNAANLNLFLHANEADGRPLRFGRDGTYAKYQEIPNYLVTLVGGYTPGYSRLRRNPGFALLSEDISVRSEIGKEYELVVTLIGGRLRYYLDSRCIHDWTDSHPLPAGNFGLRTWSTDVDWRQVEFGSLCTP
jgi:hypothetical protein